MLGNERGISYLESPQIFFGPEVTHVCRVAEAAAALKSLSLADIDRLRAEPPAQDLFRELLKQLKQAARIAKFKLE